MAVGGAVIEKSGWWSGGFTTKYAKKGTGRGRLMWSNRGRCVSTNDAISLFPFYYLNKFSAKPEETMFALGIMKFYICTRNRLINPLSIESLDFAKAGHRIALWQLLRINTVPQSHSSKYSEPTRLHRPPLCSIIKYTTKAASVLSSNRYLNTRDQIIYKCARIKSH